MGIGFGLQNIINNFVSGLILLFERPVKIGDSVQVGSDTGMVERIGIRASVLRTASGSELIVPECVTHFQQRDKLDALQPRTDHHHSAQRCPRA